MKKKSGKRLWLFFEETFKTQNSANTPGSELEANHRNPTHVLQMEEELYYKMRYLYKRNSKEALLLRRKGKTYIYIYI